MAHTDHGDRGDRGGLDPRADWELGFTMSGRGGVGSHPAWHIAIGVSWRLLAWVVERTHDAELLQEFLDQEWGLLDNRSFDAALCVLAPAVLDAAWQQDATPEEAGLAAIPARLDVLDARRSFRPAGGGISDDLWPRLIQMTVTELRFWTEVATRVIDAHAAAPGDHPPVTIADRLTFCPRYMHTRMLLQSDGRHQENRLLDPSPARRITFDQPIPNPRLNAQETGRPVIDCPDCHATHRLTITCQTGLQTVVGHCPAGHTWQVPELRSADLARIIATNRSRFRRDTPES